MQNPRKVYTKEFKVLVCEAYTQSDRTLANVAREHGINISMFSKWVRIYQQYGEKGFLPRGSKGLTLRPESPVMAPILTRWNQILPDSQVKDTVLRDQLARLKIMFAEEALEKQALQELLKKTPSTR